MMYIIFLIRLQWAILNLIHILLITFDETPLYMRHATGIYSSSSSPPIFGLLPIPSDRRPHTTPNITRTPQHMGSEHLLPPARREKIQNFCSREKCFIMFIMSRKTCRITFMMTKKNFR